MRELRLEWKESEGCQTANVSSCSFFSVWGSADEPYSFWLDWKEPRLVVSGVGLVGVKTYNEAQVAAEDALQAALLPYAQLWAKLAGVELPMGEKE